MNVGEQKLKLLENIGALINAIDTEVDWFIAYLREKDKRKKDFYYSIFLSKQDKRKELVKELNHG